MTTVPYGVARGLTWLFCAQWASTLLCLLRRGCLDGTAVATNSAAYPSLAVGALDPLSLSLPDVHRHEPRRRGPAEPRADQRASLQLCAGERRGGDEGRAFRFSSGGGVSRRKGGFGRIFCATTADDSFCGVQVPCKATGWLQPQAATLRSRQVRSSGTTALLGTCSPFCVYAERKNRR